MYYFMLGEYNFNEILIDQVFKFKTDDDIILDSNILIVSSKLELFISKFSLVLNDSSEKVALNKLLDIHDLDTFEYDNLSKIPFGSKTIPLDFSNIQCLITDSKYKLNKYMYVYINIDEHKNYSIEFYIKDTTSINYNLLYQELNILSLDKAYDKISEILNGIDLRKDIKRI